MTSSMDKELLDLLCCPKCKGDLHYVADEHRLRCKQCGTVYPVMDGIPIMLIDEGPNAVE